MAETLNDYDALAKAARIRAVRPPLKPKGADAQEIEKIKATQRERARETATREILEAQPDGK
jgi:hypothetical protein